MIRLACNEVDELIRVESRMRERPYQPALGLGISDHAVQDEVLVSLQRAIEDHEERLQLLLRARRTLDNARSLKLPPAADCPKPAHAPVKDETPALEIRYCLGCGHEAYKPHTKGCPYDGATFCRCMNLDKRCRSLHFDDTLTKRLDRRAVDGIVIDPAAVAGDNVSRGTSGENGA